MQAIKTNRVKLLEKIKANRDIHNTEVTEAIEGYRKEIRRRAARIEAAVEAGQPIGQLVADLYSTPRPDDHRQEYESIITTLELTQDEMIEVTQNEVQWYVMDQWPWRQHSLSSNALYSRVASANPLISGGIGADNPDNF